MNIKALTRELVEAFNTFDLTKAQNKFEELHSSIGPVNAMETLTRTIRNLSSDSWFLQNIHLLSIFDCVHLSGINSDLLTQLPEFEASLTLRELKEVVIRSFYEITRKQIESGSSTLLFDFDKFDGDYADLVSFGLERRQIEFIETKSSFMESIQHEKDTALIDLNQLWITHYGFKSLAQLNIGRYIEKSKLQPLLDALNDVESRISISNISGASLNFGDMKLKLVDGISNVLNGISLWTEHNENWQQPNLVQIRETITSLSVMEFAQMDNLFLEILAAVWLFPKNSQETWRTRYQILQIHQLKSNALEYDMLVKFLNTLDCSDIFPGEYCQNVLTMVLQHCIVLNKRDLYPTILKMLMCLGKNHNSVRSHIAIIFLSEHYIDQIIEDLMHRSGIKNWLDRNSESLHVDEFKTLVVDAFKKDTERDPDRFKLWYDLMKILTKLEIRDALVDITQHMHFMKPEDTGFLNDYGTSLAEAGNLDEAKRIFEGLVKQNPSDAGYINNLGYVICLSGNYEEALRLSKKAIAFSDCHHHAWHTYGAASHGLGKFQEAEKGYRKSIECEEKHLDAWEDLIRLLEEMKRFDEAEKEKARLAKVKSRMWPF